MGRDRKIKTYSRHHGSRVVAVDKDIWQSSDEQQKHVFSLSSESSINSSDSHEYPTKTRLSKRKSENKENVQRRPTKSIIPSKRYGSEMESSGSTGNDSLFQTSRRKRVLRNRSNNCNNIIKVGKRKRNPIVPINTNLTENKTDNSYNFSEFDDYSLCISGSPPKGVNPKTSSVDSRKSNIIETSTPLAKRTRSYVLFSRDDTGSCADMSYIDSVDDTPSPGSPTSELEIDRLGISNIVDSPVIVQSSINSNSNSKKSDQSELNTESPVTDCHVQLQKLRNSFLRMHILDQRNKDLSVSSNINQSASLFSNMTDSRQSESESDESDQEGVSEDETVDESDDNINNLSDIDENEEEKELEQEESCSSTDIISKESDKRGDSTRYMLNEDLSEYDTAESTGSYYTAQNESQQLDLSLPNNHCPMKSPYLTPIRLNKSQGNLKSLNESLIVMLTPMKKKNQPKVELSPKSKVFQICQQEEPISFHTCILPPMMKICTKVGEGVYGEVFRTQNNGQSVALKIMPIEGDFEVNDEPQKTFEGMLPEIVISKELSLLRTNKEAQTDNFCEVNSVACVKGKYPRELLKQWDIFHKEEESENDRPDIFTDQQLFIVFEFADGGKNLESARLHNIFEARSVLTQVAYSLAIAEQVLQFEHRDLHWGNILVKKTKKTHIKYKLMDQTFQVENYNIHVSIIDFTLSRLHADGVTTYNNLATDDTLFEGKGDYQFDIYRKMKTENGNNWETFNPKSNVWWLHYLTDKLLRRKQYTRNTKNDQALFREMRLLLKEMPNYSSACELVTCLEFFSS